MLLGGSIIRGEDSCTGQYCTEAGREEASYLIGKSEKNEETRLKGWHAAGKSRGGNIFPGKETGKSVGA